MKSQRLRSRFSPKKELYFYKTQMTVDLKVTKDSSLLCERLCYCCLRWTMHTSSSGLSQLLKLLSSVFYHFFPPVSRFCVTETNHPSSVLGLGCGGCSLWGICVFFLLISLTIFVRDPADSK